MKIDWLNSDMTEAQLTRGWWRWKRRAVVVRFEPEHSWDPRWKHMESGKVMESGESYCIETERSEAMQRHENERDWQPVRDVPRARLVERAP